MINEIFYSVQGEGRYIGLPMAFIRLTGCNLKCKWCDTKYAFTKGDELTFIEILDRIKVFPTHKVCQGLLFVFDLNDINHRRFLWLIRLAVSIG